MDKAPKQDVDKAVTKESIKYPEPAKAEFKATVMPKGEFDEFEDEIEIKPNETAD